LNKIRYLKNNGLYVVKDNPIITLDNVPSGIIPPGTIFSGDDFYIDDIPIRQDIEILGPDIPKTEAFDHNFIIIDPKKRIYQKTLAQRQLKLGWSVSETIGIMCINPRAITKAKRIT